MATRGAHTRSKKGSPVPFKRSYDAAHPWHIVYPYHGHETPQPTVTCPVRMDIVWLTWQSPLPQTPSPRIETFECGYLGAWGGL